MFSKTPVEEMLADAQPDGKQQSMLAFRRRVAAELSRSNDWISEDNRNAGRKNPWHESMDETMFYI